MAERWAKVPEWLVLALVAAERKRGDATPASALLAYTVLRVRFADWRSNIACASREELATACGTSRSSAARSIDALNAVGAVSVIADATAWRARGQYLLAGDAPFPTSGHLRVALPTGGEQFTTGGQRADNEPAGQTVGRVPLVVITSQRQESSPDEHNASQEDVWGLLDTSNERPPEEVVQRALHDSFERLGREPRKVRALRAASPPPGPGARLQDSGGTSGSTESEIAGDATSATGEGRGS